ncbi:MAG: hypothetical protein PSV16_04225 [Flavobacterium sp.]|nr:hypothetical protein [Flavobacterium sp.]
MLLLSLNSCKPSYCTEFSGIPAQVIPVAQALEMHTEYKTRVAPRIEKDRPDYQATEFTWVSLDTLKKYVALLERVKDLNDKEISGIRVYFAAYPNSNTYRTVAGKQIKYPDRETLFIVPTIPVPSGENSNIYPLLENLPFGIRPSGTDPLVGDFEIIEGLLLPTDNRNISLHSRTGDEAKEFDATTIRPLTSLILNDMQMVPPPKQ